MTALTQITQQTMQASHHSQFCLLGGVGGGEGDSDTDGQRELSRGRGSRRTRGRGVLSRARGKARSRRERAGMSRGGGRGRGRGGISDFDNTTLFTPNNEQPEVPVFTGNPGLNVHHDGDKPIEYYKLFLAEEFVDHLVNETNKYVDQTVEEAGRREQLSPHSRLKSWIPVD